LFFSGASAILDAFVHSYGSIALALTYPISNIIPLSQFYQRWLQLQNNESNPQKGASNSHIHSGSQQPPISSRSVRYASTAITTPTQALKEDHLIPLEIGGNPQNPKNLLAT
jgi:hypothetical protein